MSPSTSYRDRSMNASLSLNASATFLPLSTSTPSQLNSQGSLLDQWNKLVELSKNTSIRRQVSSNWPSTSTALKPATIVSRSAHDDQLSTATDQAAPYSEESSSSANSSLKPNERDTIRSSTSSNPEDLSNIASTSSSSESTSSLSGNAPGQQPSSTSPLSQTANVTSENTVKLTNNTPAARSDDTSSGSAIPAPNIESPQASSSSSTGNEHVTLCEEGHSYVENGICLICAPRKAAEESERIDRERAEQKEKRETEQRRKEELEAAQATEYELKLEQMRREAHRQLERNKREEGELLRIRFHFQSGIRQKSFSGNDTLKDVYAFIRSQDGSSYHFRLTDRISCRQFSDASFSDNAPVSDVFKDGISLCVSWDHRDFELPKENNSDPTDANMSDASTRANDSIATVDERQATISTQIRPENNSQLIETTRPQYQNIEEMQELPEQIFEEYGPVAFPSEDITEIEVERARSPTPPPPVSPTPSPPMSPSVSIPDSDHSTSSQHSSDESEAAPRRRRSLDLFHSIIEAERQRNDPALSEEELIEDRRVETLTLLRSCINPDSAFHLDVQRDRLWESFKEETDRPSFDHHVKLDVVFVDVNGNGEGGVDQGGPTTELITLLMEEVMNRPVWKYNEKEPNNKYLVLNYDELRKGSYTVIGRIIVLALLHGGMRPHFIATKCARAIIRGLAEPKRLNLDDLYSSDDRENLAKAARSKTKVTKERALKQVAGYGLVGPLRDNTAASLQDLTRKLLHYSLVGQHAAAYDQLRHEMQKLGVLRYLSKNIKGALTLFTSLKEPTAKDVVAVFSKNVHYSPSYKSRHPIEEQHFQWFKTFIAKLAENQTEVNLGDLLRVVTGMPYVPESGVNSDISVGFHHDEDLAEVKKGGLLPFFSTCPPAQVNLPVSCTDYVHFEQRMIWGIRGGLGAFLAT